MGGGLPAAAFGGRRELMSLLAPLGPVYQAGTLSGNPLAVAAGLATLRACTPEVYAAVDASSAQRRPSWRRRRLPSEGVAHTVGRAGSLFSIFFTDGVVTDYATAQRQNVARYAAFFHSMLDAGIYLPPSAYEAWFTSAAHDDEAIERIADGAAGRRQGGRRRPERSPTSARGLDAGVARERTHDHSPGAPRRGLQPHQGALRTAAGLPAVGRGPGAGRGRRPLPDRSRHRRR